MNFSNNNPIYLEIYHQYKKYIELEVYKPNDKLPSVRALANDLGINPNTVQRAYTLLEDEGFIETLPKKGVYVKTRNNLDNKLKLVKKEIENFKSNGLSKEQLLEIIKEVYND
jgi:GntR family transcriptional regulator